MNQPLQDRYAEALARRSPDRAGCPSPDELQRLADRSLGETDRLRLFDHVMACADCHREYAMLDAVEAGKPRRAAPRLFALAATLLLAVGVSLLWRATRPGGEVVRGDEFTVQLLAPDPGVVPANPRFAWRGGSVGSTYRFEILQEGGVPLYGVLTTDTSLVLPDSVNLLPDVEYRWWVQVIELGRTQAASDFRRLRTAAP